LKLVGLEAKIKS